MRTVQQKPFSEVLWVPRPRLPLGLLGAGLGFALFVVAVLLIRAAVGADALRPLPARFGLLLLGFFLVGGALAAVRARAARRAAVSVRCEDQGLRLDRDLLPYAIVEQVEYGQVQATGRIEPGRADKTSDAVLTITTGRGVLRLAALDTVVTDFETALAPIEQANPQALVRPQMPRSWK